jgi:peptidoglycan hydrolase-like protein with peptidoglycan-binding domain
VSSAPQIPLVAQAKSALLKADEIRELQGKLKALSFDPGPADGVVGPMTLSAIRKYSEARAIANAEATRDLLVRLRSEPPPKK